MAIVLQKIAGLQLKEDVLIDVRGDRIPDLQEEIDNQFAAGATRLDSDFKLTDQAVMDIVAKLDVNDVASWNKGGTPNLAAVNALVLEQHGDKVKCTRDQLDRVWSLISNEGDEDGD